MRKRNNFLFLLLLSNFIFILDFLKIFFIITWIRIFIFNILNSDKKIFNNFLKPRKYIKDTILQRKLGIYEIDTNLILNFLSLQKFESLIEIGAARGYFSKKMLACLNKRKKRTVNTKLVSIEPSKNLYTKFLLPLKKQYNDQIYLINDFCGPNSSLETKNYLKRFFDGISPNSSFLFLDADFEDITPCELAIGILKTINITKINLFLIEMGNKNPIQDAKLIKYELLNDFKIIRFSKKRFLFLRDI